MKQYDNKDEFILDQILSMSNYIEEISTLTAKRFFFSFKDRFRISKDGKVEGYIDNKDYVPLEHAAAHYCKEYPKPLELCFLYNLRNTEYLPCKGKLFDFDKIVFEADGSINKTFQTLYHMLSELPDFTLIEKQDIHSMIQLSNSLLELSKYLYTGAKQLTTSIGLRYRPNFLMQLYPSMAHLRDFLPELCEICFNNKNGRCEILSTYQEEMKDFRSKHPELQIPSTKHFEPKN